MIAHLDADSFFASVLVRQYPHLRGKPLLALGMGGGCVIAASYEAKWKGVKTGMPLTDALKLVPDAIRMNASFQEAGLASEQIERILRDHCPRIEQMSIDEWYLDLRTLVGGVPADPVNWGRWIQKTIKDRTALPVSVGIAPTKLLAKMAGEYRKPVGVTVVGGAALDIRTFLRDRPAPAIPGIGRRTSPHVEAKGWHTAWDIATAPSDELRAICGRPGIEMQRELLGESLFPVSTEVPPPKSVSRARSFKPAKDSSLLWAHVLRHVEYTVLKMRRHSLACKGVSVWLRDKDFRFESAHCPLPQPTSTEEALQPYIRRCFRRIHSELHTYTQVGLALWNLCPQGALQYSLFEEPDRLCRSEAVQQTLDDIHKRFGRNAITRGSAMGAKTGTRRGLEVSTF